MLYNLLKYTYFVYLYLKLIHIILKLKYLKYNLYIQNILKHIIILLNFQLSMYQLKYLFDKPFQIITYIKHICNYFLSTLYLYTLN